MEEEEEEGGGVEVEVLKDGAGEPQGGVSDGLMERDKTQEEEARDVMTLV